MQAIMRDVGGFEWPLLHVPPVWRPALTTSVRLTMGLALGGMIGLAAGHSGFWLVVGSALGASLDAIARRN